MKKRFQGPYTVVRKIDSVNHGVNARKRRRKTQGCHVKKKEGIYVDRQSQPILTIKNKNGRDRKNDVGEGNKAEYPLS